jgi:hypothetical protein
MKVFSKTAVIISFSILLFSSVSAQYIDGGGGGNQNLRFSERLFYGGILGMQFGSEVTFIEVAPLIGYRFNNRLSAGLHLKYMYQDVHPDYYPNYSTNIYGGGPFARFFVYEGLFAHFEYEILNMDVPDLYGGYRRENVTSVFVGGGYRQMLGQKSAMDIMLLYNVNESTYSPYVNPILQFGFAFGI